MSKIAIIGDTHFSPKTPVSRKDDYPNTLLNKLNNLLLDCINNNVTDCIFLGDLINANQMTMDYFIRLYKQFLQFSTNNIKLHLILGNHDLPHGNEEFLVKSPIAILLDSELFNNKSFVIDDCYFELSNYYNTVDKLQIHNEFHNIHCKVFCGHYFYLSGYNDTLHTITPEICNKLDYQFYFLGHDHTPYDVLKLKTYEVHRPGSFSRATSDTCQISRDNINFCIFDTETKTVEYKAIQNTLLSKDIYKEAKLLSKLNETENIDTTLSEDIENLISSLSFNFSSDIYTVLDSLNIEQNVKERVIKYLEEEGIYR